VTNGRACVSHAAAAMNSRSRSSAPIPFGGGLIFVPHDWVRPADFGVEALTNIYISMGLTAPQYQATAARGAASG